VLSDLHLFARRSAGQELMRDLLPDLKRVRLLVLNGDIVDFRWSTLGSHQETVRRSVDWLEELIASLPGCQVRYVLGNHDCHAAFVPALERLAGTHSGFHWHEFSLQLDGILFLHGDCTNWRMDQRSLERLRRSWSRSRRRGTSATNAYRALDRLGVTRVAHRWQFPVGRTLDRLTYHLDEAHPGWSHEIRHCYFGHTHEPFRDIERQGVRFHNTGSAIRSMKFNPLPLPLASGGVLGG
jgi:UDP-2,3-diacylglucosamine hydrolase